MTTTHTDYLKTLSTSDLTRMAIQNARCLDNCDPASHAARSLIRQRAEIRGELAGRLAK